VVFIFTDAVEILGEQLNLGEGGRWAAFWLQ
jgi:hypothetical protein